MLPYQRCRHCGQERSYVYIPLVNSNHLLFPKYYLCFHTLEQWCVLTLSPFDGLSVVEDDRQSRDCLFVHADHRRAAAAPLLPPYPTTYLKAAVHYSNRFGINHESRPTPSIRLHEFKGHNATIDNLFVFGHVVDTVGQKQLKKVTKPKGMSTHHHMRGLDRG